MNRIRYFLAALALVALGFLLFPTAVFAAGNDGIGDVDYGTADLAFLAAFIALLVVGIISLVQRSERSVLTGVAWIATSAIALGLMFLTP